MNDDYDFVESVDVAVVGYGPVGMVTAALIGRAGYRVTVLERYEGLYNLPRAATFDDETMRTFATLGIAERLLPTLRRQPTYEWRNGSGDLLIEQRFADVGASGWAEWYMMYQPELEDALDEVCRSLSNVDVRLSSPVTGVHDEGDSVLLTIDAPEGTRRLRASYVVAADGGNSFVRQAVGARQEDYGFSEPWMVCDFELRVGVEVPPALQLGDPRQPTSIISIGPAHHRFSFMLDRVEDFETERDPAKVWDRVSRWLGPDDAELIRVATYTFRSLVADRWRVGRVLLAGDAAHQMPPFLGQGMCSGVRDAQNLAFKLGLVLDGSAAPDLLDTYQTEREPHVRAVIEKGIELGRAQTVRDPEKAAARDRALLEKRARAEVPEGFEFPGLGAGMFAAVDRGARGQISVQGIVDDGSHRDRLDQVVGAGWHFLVAPGIRSTLPDSTLAALDAAGVRVVEIRPPGLADSDAVADVDGTYQRWFDALGCCACVVRPDFYIWGSAADAEETAALGRELVFSVSTDADVVHSAE